jgi:hypothetical protein
MVGDPHILDITVAFASAAQLAERERRNKEGEVMKLCLKHFAAVMLAVFAVAADPARAATHPNSLFVVVEDISPRAALTAGQSCCGSDNIVLADEAAFTGYRIDARAWRLYTAPVALRAGFALKARAVRYGHAESAAVGVRQ